LYRDLAGQELPSLVDGLIDLIPNVRDQRAPEWQDKRADRI
jgi:hypothetical protein